MNSYFAQVMQKADDIHRNPETDAVVATLRQGERNIELVFMQGDIAGAPLTAVEAVVNAANDRLFYGGGGTNGALSRIFEQESWREQAHKHHNHLDLSEVAVFTFKFDKKSSPLPKYLFHALGPVIADDHFEQYGEAVYRAYSNIFKECRRLNVRSILLCLLSSGIFAGCYQNDPRWQEYVKEALFRALLEELEQPNGELKTIHIIDYIQCPFATAFKIE